MPSPKNIEAKQIWKEKLRKIHLGIPLKEEHKKKISLGNKGKIFTLEHRRKLSISNKGKHPNFGITTRLKKGQTGNKSISWKGGVAPFVTIIRRSQKYLEWRQQIFIRDNFTCQKCFKRGGDLEVHHHKKRFSILLQEVKKYLPLFNFYDGAMIYTPLWDIKNGITLCEKCHKKTKKCSSK